MQILPNPTHTSVNSCNLALSFESIKWKIGRSTEIQPETLRR